MKRLLIAGFGDVARRAAPRLEPRFALLRVSRTFGFDLDRPGTLAFEPVDAVLHCAPPPGEGDTDPRTAQLLAALVEVLEDRAEEAEVESQLAIYLVDQFHPLSKKRPGSLDQLLELSRRQDAEEPPR